MVEKFLKLEIQKVPEEIADEKIGKKQILEMSPSELVAFFTNLEINGQLEKFLEKAKTDDALLAQFSYWEKWLEKDHQKLVDKVVAEKKSMYDSTELGETLPLSLEKKFTEKELKLLFSHLVGIQLTFGCSKGCPFCGVDAVPGVREYIPYSQLANLFKKYGKQINKSKPFLYWASEPSDYADKIGLEDKTYLDVHQLAVEYAEYDPSITTKETKDERWLDFLKIVSKKQPVRVSLFNLPQVEKEKRSEKIKKLGENGKGIDIAGLDYEHYVGYGKSFDQKSHEELFDEWGRLRKNPVIIGRSGIGCKNGILMTPRGLYNTAVLPISKEFPQGIITCPLEEISNIEINPGDSLLDILRHSIIVRPHDASESRKDSITVTADHDFENQGEFLNMVKIRLDLDIKTKNNSYRIWFDEKGIIQKVKKLYTKNINKNKEKIVNYSEKYAKYFMKLDEIDKMPFSKQVKQWDYLVKDLIIEAVNENEFDIYSSWSVTDKKEVVDLIKSRKIIWRGEDGSIGAEGLRWRATANIARLGEIDGFIELDKKKGLKLKLI